MALPGLLPVQERLKACDIGSASVLYEDPAMAPRAPRIPSRQQSQKQPSPGLVTLARDEQPEIDLEIKKPHFLARVCRTDSMDEAWSLTADIRSIYPDARYCCSVLTLTGLSDGHALAATASSIEHSSDDGESSGTAGQSMLDVLRGTGLANTTVIATRYSDGTLLGTGGLVRAYSETTAQALQAAARVTPTRLHLWDLRAPVAQADRIEVELRPRDPVTASGPMAEGGTVVSAPTIHVEETIWGSTHAIPVLAMSCADPDLLHVSLAALTRDEGTAEPVGSQLVKVPVSPA